MATEHEKALNRARSVKWRKAHKAVHQARTDAWRIENPIYNAYIQQRCAARQRKIHWGFTFETWLAWWGADYSRRGRHTDDLCCARIGDIGPYYPTNCIKLTMRENKRAGRRHGKTFN